MKIKKGLPKILSIILGLTLLLSITQTAFASKSKSNIDNARVAKQVNYANYWTRVVSVSTSNGVGLNCNVAIDCYNTRGQNNDVIMYGQNGQVVWQENSAITSGGGRTFWCGTDVYKVCIRQSGVNAGIPSVCNVSY